MTGGGTEVTRPIELIIPGTSRHIRLARLMAGGIVTTYGLSMRLVEDVRIAVDEVCATLIETGQGEPLRLAFKLEDDVLVVEGTTPEAAPETADRRRLAISHRILDVLAASHNYMQADGHATFTVTIPMETSTATVD